VSLFEFSLRSLCGLGVSAVKFDMHRRGAENAEETQRFPLRDVYSTGGTNAPDSRSNR